MYQTFLELLAVCGTAWRGRRTVTPDVQTGSTPVHTASSSKLFNYIQRIRNGEEAGSIPACLG